MEQDPRTIFPIPFWYEWNHCEPTVQLALRDLCRPGDVVFDVGANAGALTLVMSRLVGPRGIVCAFEASRRIVDKCQYNLVQNGCTNAQVYHRAVHERSNETVRIYAGADLNDTLVREWAASDESSEVKTVALDDFIAYMQLLPNLIKMDIERTEYEALCGMSRALGSIRPHLILEQQPDDLRCHAVLRAAGYVAIDLATLKVIEGAADFVPGAEVVNLLFVHRSRLSETPYQAPFRIAPVATLDAAAFQRHPDGSRELASPLELAPGRYLFAVDFSARGEDNEMFAGVERNGVTILRYHTNTHFLSTSYRHWVVQLEAPSWINIFLRFQSGTRDETLDLRGATVSRVDAFPASRLPLVD